MGFTYTFYTCKGKKNEKLTKNYWGRNQRTSEVVMWQGKHLFLNIGIEEQQNCYEQWGKEGFSELIIKIT